MDLRDYDRRLRVSGPAVNQVNAISASLEQALSEHSAIGGDTVRFVAGGIIFTVLLALLLFGATYCFLEGHWHFLGVPIFAFIGLALLFVLPLREVFAGFAVYQGEPSFIVRYEPQIAFGGLIVTILLSFLIPMWRDARRKKSTPKEE